MEHQFHSIKQKYFLYERTAINDDPLVDSVYEYFKKSNARIYGYIITSNKRYIAALFFLLLLIPSIVL
jgi:hypothetical protein